MKEVLGLDLTYPSYRVGVPETLREMGVLEERG